MATPEPFGQHGRMLLAIALLVVLAGAMVAYGTVDADPDDNTFPTNEQVGPDPDSYVGERVDVGGEVVSTDPVVIEVQYTNGLRTITVENATAALLNTDGPIEPGDRVSAFGTLEDPTTLSAERSISRAQWEFGYMYFVSFLGGLWVLGRFFQGWRFDRNRLAFVPRDERRSLAELVRGPSSTIADQGVERSMVASAESATPTESAPVDRNAPDGSHQHPPNNPETGRGEQ